VSGGEVSSALSAADAQGSVVVRTVYRLDVVRAPTRAAHAPAGARTISSLTGTAPSGGLEGRPGRTPGRRRDGLTSWSNAPLPSARSTRVAARYRPPPCWSDGQRARRDHATQRPRTLRSAQPSRHPHRGRSWSAEEARQGRVHQREGSGLAGAARRVWPLVASPPTAALSICCVLPPGSCSRRGRRSRRLHAHPFDRAVLPRTGGSRNRTA